MAKLTQAQTISALADDLGKSKAEVKEILTKIAEKVYKELKSGGGELTLPGLCKIVKVKRKARMGRNPQTGEEIKIAAKTVVKCRPVKALKDAVL